MEVNNKYIRFDWAVKRMLRDKANFAVLEGLVTVLLGEKITISEILESEGNQETETDKFNRVDIKARNSKGEIIIVEVQLTRQLYYLQRMLYGVSKAITEHIQIGEKYDNVKKVYSINILYFDLGKGNDYLYRGKTHRRTHRRPIDRKHQRSRRDKDERTREHLSRILHHTRQRVQRSRQDPS